MSDETVTHYNQVEQVVNKPSVYIGVNDITTRESWIFDKRTKLIVNRDIEFNYAMLHLFEEVIVNARDNEVNDKYQKNIYVTYDKNTGEISVMNDGAGMSFDKITYRRDDGSEDSIHNPEAAFFMLGSSTHYTDEEFITGGTHGIGVKLVSILSEYFKVEIKHKKKILHTIMQFSLK